MKHKTYLSRDVQWDRTVGWYLDMMRQYGVRLGVTYVTVLDREFPHEHPSERTYMDRVHVGRIIYSHRLFRVGDFVLYGIDNGQAKRHGASGMSSKGFWVHGFHLNFSDGGKYNCVTRTFFEPKQMGPMESVCHPDELAGLPINHTKVREFVLGYLRAGVHIG